MNHPLKCLPPISSIMEKTIFSADALQFISALQKEFQGRQIELLVQRQKRQKELNDNLQPDFLSTTSKIRSSNYTIESLPKDLLDRRTEITGPVDAKMVINALNSGAKVFMADFEDSCSPTWENISSGQLNLYNAVRKTLHFKNEQGKSYHLNDHTAVLMVRPRGLHLLERHVQFENKNFSASLFDFGLFFFHNALELLKRGSGPYFYLPKLESHLEARFWNDVFNFSQKYLQIPPRTIKATVLIETILAAFEMDEILFELKDHSAGLNAGRWDYLFSCIKKFRNPKNIFPERSYLTMTTPFMSSYAKLLVETCHKRNAPAIGGMAAFIPSRKDIQINETAMKKVSEDKIREANLGFDGTWVAHPDLVPIAVSEFSKVLGTNPNQISKKISYNVSASDLLNFNIPNSTITETGIVNNINISLLYLNSWLNGVGAAGIHNLMEDVATAEISRSQLWQWIHFKAQTDTGIRIDEKYIRSLLQAEMEKLPEIEKNKVKIQSLFNKIVFNNEFCEFLTIPAYELLEKE